MDSSTASGRRLRRSRLAGTVFAMAFPAGAIAGSQYIVISAEPALEAFEPGTKFVVNDVLTVPEGATVTLLGEDGTVTAIPGPARVIVTEDAVEGAAAPDPQKVEAQRSTLAKLGELLAGDQPRSETLGVSRSLDNAKNASGLDDPWALSAEESGQGCFRDGAVTLARKDVLSTASVTYRYDGAAAAQEQVWPKGDAGLSLAQPVPENAKRLMLEMDKTFAAIDLHRLPPAIEATDTLGLLGWMLDSGCDRQARVLVRKLASDAN